MPPLSEVRYSRDDCISAIRDYYSFLTKMYLNEDEVLEPPEGGWPNITAHNLKGFDKTDEVINLLRHLPYIENVSDNTTAHGSARCCFADWRYLAGDTPGASNETLSWTTEDNFDGSVPAHVIGLTSPRGHENTFFLLDTQLGIIHWRSCPHEWRYHQVRDQITDRPDKYAPKEEWRGDAPAWAVGDFFEVLKERFRCLDFVPINNRNVLYAYNRNPMLDQGVVPMVQNIYHAHGWPDLRTFRKHDCLLAIRTAMEAQYPDVGLNP
ncbi:hypothetical protein SVAN01_07477 [Stagonosporopsis vannaccii]|nr:hypothetical protein SVAN01_07477 [Stagonosporopsis vannaccii]